MLGQSKCNFFSFVRSLAHILNWMSCVNSKMLCKISLVYHFGRAIIQANVVGCWSRSLSLLPAFCVSRKLCECVARHCFGYSHKKLCYSIECSAWKWSANPKYVRLLIIFHLDANGSDGNAWHKARQTIFNCFFFLLVFVNIPKIL